jgi:ankyrin repeat protein
MLLESDELVYEICLMADADMIGRLRLASRNLRRSCSNAILLIFMQVFGVKLNDPTVVLPRNTMELIRLLKRSRSWDSLDELSEVFSYSCAAGYSKFVRDCLGRSGLSARNFLVNNISSNGCHPMTLGVSSGKYEIVESLLKNQSDVNIIDIRGRSPLWYACERGSFNILNLLIDSGAIVDSEPSVISAFFNSPIYAGHPSTDFFSILRLVANRMLDSLDSSFHAFDPFDLAWVQNMAAKIARLLDPISLFLKSPNTNDQLLFELLDILDGRLQRALDFARTSGKLFSHDPPLYIAASMNKHIFIERLISCGISTPNDISNLTGKSALFIAAEKGNKDTVIVLLNLKASVGTLTATGRNCLHAAVEKDHTEIVEILCEHATTDDIMHLNSGQISPFTLAENRGRLRMVTAMLRCYKRTVSDSTISHFLNSKVSQYLMKTKPVKRGKPRTV